MDYIKLLKGFRRKRLSNPISANAIALYYILTEYDNDLFFLEWFTVPNSTLQGLCGLSVTSLQRARNELIQKGYIQHRKGSGNQAGSYKILDLSIKSEQQMDSNCVSNQSTDVSTNVQQVDSSCATLTKPNQTKTRPNNTPPSPPAGEDDESPKWKDELNRFWKAYPRKVGKGKCEGWFKSHKPKPEMVGQMLEAVDQQKRSEQWTKDGGKYIPHPYTWLNGKRWEDEPQNEQPQKKSFAEIVAEREAEM